jgi:multidrug efflux pump subunit AcrA (membrane-fusion protein)
MTLRKVIIVIAGIGVLVVAVGLQRYMGTLKEAPEKRPQQEFKKFVRTKTVEYADLKTEVIAYGRVRTSAPLDLISEVSGRLKQGSIPLKEGQRFKKGALLFVIDDTEAKLNLQSEKSDFLKDVAGILPDIKIDMNDNFEAWDAFFKSIDVEKPLPPLPEAKSAKEKTFLATKGIYSKFYTIKSSESRLSKHHYYAPFDGSITLVNLQTGSFVNSGGNIAKVLRSDMMELKLSVDTKDISWVKIGTPVRIIGEDQVTEWKAKISRISEYVNSATQSIDVYVDIAPGQGPIYDGQYFKASIPGTFIRSVLEMPRNAIFEGNQVYLLRDSILEAATVNILKLNPETAIINGLARGSELVVEPMVSAYSGMKAFKLSEKVDIDLETKSDSKETAKQ